MLYLLFKLSWSGSAGTNNRGAVAAAPSNAYQLDLFVVKGGVCSFFGAHVVHCLGGAWLPWLAGWLLWCGCQLLPQMRLVGRLHSSLLVVVIAVAAPLLVSFGCFLPEAIRVQGFIVDALPALRLPPLLLPWQL